MAEVIRNEAPVLIENVNLVINVFNINGPQTGGDGGPPTRGMLPNGLIQSSTTSTVSPNSGSIDASCSLQNLLSGPELNLKAPTPLGWVVSANGDLIPFGVLPTHQEIQCFGDRVQWREIRVCLPPSLLADETDFYCPVSVCREKLPRNKSMDSHIKKHLGFTEKESHIPVCVTNVKGALSCPLFYYCYDKNCQYYAETAEKSFKAYKNVKQHYQKVHAPRLLGCDQCQKTFSTLKVLENHKLSCGEKYTCSTCNRSYNTMESLQTHCRRKAHTYDSKYKDRRNSVKQEMQSQKATPTPTAPTSAKPKYKSNVPRKLPPILPKRTAHSSPEFFSTIQTFCQQAGLKVDLGCQTVCTAFIQKIDPVEAAVVSPTTPSFAQKKRKSTDTQTNIVKFRATCLDQKNNATNTNLDWKKVITSDSQTQTADTGEAVELSTTMLVADSSVHFNDEFATFKISETHSSKVESVLACTDSESIFVFSNDKDLELVNIKEEPQITAGNAEEVKVCSAQPAENDHSIDVEPKPATTTEPLKVGSGPSLHSEFINFLEATDSATQTDPDMFDMLGIDEGLGIQALFGEDLADTVEDDHYVSVSSTASQTAVESVPSVSLSAEDYEALLSGSDDPTLINLNAINDYKKTAESSDITNNGITSNFSNQSEVTGELISNGHHPQQGTNYFMFNEDDWANIVEQVYRDVDDD